MISVEFEPLNTIILKAKLRCEPLRIERRIDFDVVIEVNEHVESFGGPSWASNQFRVTRDGCRAAVSLPIRART